ncbi:MAG: tetratricopeptide repeat protein [Chryseolinea sp.]
MKIWNIPSVANTLLSMTLSMSISSAFGNSSNNNVEQIEANSTLLNIHCDALYDLAYHVVDSNLTAAVTYGRKSLEIALKLGDTTRMLKAARITSYAYRQTGLIDSAFRLLIKYIPIARRNKNHEQLRYMLNSLGLTYLDMSVYDQAMKFCIENLQVSEDYGSQTEIAQSLNNLGVVYFKLEDYDAATVYFSKSLVIYNQLQNKLQLSNTGFNLSLCYAYQKQFKKASIELERAYSACSGTCPTRVLVNAKFSEALINFGNQDLLNAEKYFLQSYKLASELNYERLRIDNISYLNKIYLLMNNQGQLRKFASISEELIQDHFTYSEGVAELCSGLINVYERNGNFLKANEYKNKYIALKDSLFNRELTKNLMRIEAKYTAQKNKDKIESQNKILVLNNKLINRQHFLNVTLGVVIFLFALVVVVLIWNIRIKKFTNRLLELKVKQRTIELEENQNSLQRNIDEQDIRMVKISDDVKKALATIKGLCILVENDPDEPMTSEYIKKINSTSNQLLIIISRFSGG